MWIVPDETVGNSRPWNLDRAVTLEHGLSDPDHYAVYAIFSLADLSSGGKSRWQMLSKTTLDVELEGIEAGIDWAERTIGEVLAQIQYLVLDCAGRGRCAEPGRSSAIAGTRIWFWIVRGGGGMRSRADHPFHGYPDLVLDCAGRGRCAEPGR